MASALLLVAAVGAAPGTAAVAVLEVADHLKALRLVQAALQGAVVLQDHLLLVAAAAVAARSTAARRSSCL